MFRGTLRAFRNSPERRSQVSKGLARPYAAGLLSSVGGRRFHVGAPFVSGSVPMIDDLLEHPLMVMWRKAYPQLWWAFQQLGRHPELQAKVVAAVLAKREHEDEHVDQLLRFGESLETRKRAEGTGTVMPPPEAGERRPFEVYVKRMKRMEREGKTFFRVDFSTQYGWSGYFDTTSPNIVERVHKHRRRERPLTLVGEVTQRPYDFLVVLDDHVQIV